MDISEWVHGNDFQINQVRSWLSDARRVNVAREIVRIKNVNPSEALAMYQTWEGHILSMTQQGFISIFLDNWMGCSDRDLAHAVLRKQWGDDYRQRVSKSDSELRDAALRKRARKNQLNSSGGRASESSSEAGSTSSNPLAEFEYYKYCVEIVNEIGRMHGANSKEMDEVWPVMVEALGRAVGAFKAWEFQGKITPGSDLAEKYLFLLKEIERILTR